MHMTFYVITSIINRNRQDTKHVPGIRITLICITAGGGGGDEVGRGVVTCKLYLTSVKNE